MRKRKAQSVVSHDADVGRRLEKARKATGLTPTEAAALTGQSLSNVVRLESGKVSLLAQMALQFARLYRVSPAWLMFGEEEGFAHPKQQAA